jgi:hypothetical protein
MTTSRTTHRSGENSRSQSLARVLTPGLLILSVDFVAGRAGSFDGKLVAAEFLT